MIIQSWSFLFGQSYRVNDAIEHFTYLTFHNASFAHNCAQKGCTSVRLRIDKVLYDGATNIVYLVEVLCASGHIFPFTLLFLHFFVEATFTLRTVFNSTKLSSPTNEEHYRCARAKIPARACYLPGFFIQNLTRLCHQRTANQMVERGNGSETASIEKGNGNWNLYFNQLNDLKRKRELQPLVQSNLKEPSLSPCTTTRMAVEPVIPFASLLSRSSLFANGVLRSSETMLSDCKPRAL